MTAHPAWCNVRYHWSDCVDHCADIGTQVSVVNHGFIEVGLEQTLDGEQRIVFYVSPCDGEGCDHRRNVANMGDPDCAGGDGALTRISVPQATLLVQQLHDAIALAGTDRAPAGRTGRLDVAGGSHLEVGAVSAGDDRYVYVHACDPLHGGADGGVDVVQATPLQASDVVARMERALSLVGGNSASTLVRAA